MVSASAATSFALANMLRYMYAISRFRRSVLDFSYCSKKWLTFGAFRVNQKALQEHTNYLTNRKQEGNMAKSRKGDTHGSAQN
jgi:hypothetical protein